MTVGRDAPNQRTSSQNPGNTSLWKRWSSSETSVKRPLRRRRNVALSSSGSIIQYCYARRFVDRALLHVISIDTVRADDFDGQGRRAIDKTVPPPMLHRLRQEPNGRLWPAFRPISYATRKRKILPKSYLDEQPEDVRRHLKVGATVFRGSKK